MHNRVSLMPYLSLQFSKYSILVLIHIVEVNVVNKIMLLSTDITQTYRNTVTMHLFPSLQSFSYYTKHIEDSHMVLVKTRQEKYRQMFFIFIRAMTGEVGGGGRDWWLLVFPCKHITSFLFPWMAGRCNSFLNSPGYIIFLLTL